MTGSCLHVNDRSCSMKDEEFLDLLSNYNYFNVYCRLINTVSGTNNNYTLFLTVKNGLNTYPKYKKA